MRLSLQFIQNALTRVHSSLYTVMLRYFRGEVTLMTDPTQGKLCKEASDST